MAARPASFHSWSSSSKELMWQSDLFPWHNWSSSSMEFMWQTCFPATADRPHPRNWCDRLVSLPQLIALNQNTDRADLFPPELTVLDKETGNYSSQICFPLSRFSLVVRRLAGKQKDMGSIPFQLSFLFKCCGLWTLSSWLCSPQLMKH